MNEKSQNYVGGSKTVRKPHSIKHEELTEWLRVWGIVGRRRPPPLAVDFGRRP